MKQVAFFVDFVLRSCRGPELDGNEQHGSWLRPRRDFQKNSATFCSFLRCGGSDVLLPSIPNPETAMTQSTNSAIPGPATTPPAPPVESELRQFKKLLDEFFANVEI